RLHDPGKYDEPYYRSPAPGRQAAALPDVPTPTEGRRRPALRAPRSSASPRTPRGAPPARLMLPRRPAARHRAPDLPISPMPSAVQLPVIQPARPRSRAEGPDAKEKCGVFGVWGHPEAVRLTYLGLYALQHRGQESAGIAISDG